MALPQIREQQVESAKVSAPLTLTDGFKDIEKLERDLWEAADNLRANSKLTSSDYFMPVLGVIFLRHAANRFEAAHRQIEADKATGKMPKRKVLPADYVARRSLFLPEEARYDWIMQQASVDGADLPKLVTDAMTAIEKSFEPLQGVLPKDYGIFESKVLEDLLRLFNSDQIRNATGDVFGRIYEYFLAEFSIQKAHDNGEFFTPSSIVQTIVNVIEPDHGIVFDPASGSGGMFVQSSHFIEHEGEDTAKRVVFYGQEKNRDTIRIAQMNLAVHGLEGKIAEAITYYQDEHTLVGKCDFVMANPPFNVDLVDAKRIATDPRLPFGLPGVNKEKKVGNGNYLWISYFWSYLNENGRAGFVMSSQASSAGHGEKDVRRKIVETGDVDVMISIRSNFFYTRSVPCELWHFDRGKPAERQDQALMLDARNIFRKVTRKINDFTPEQLANIAAIVWLYRGQSQRFISLVQRYLGRTIAEAARIEGTADAFQKSYTALAETIAPFLKTWEAGLESLKERDAAAEACFVSIDKWNSRIAKEWTKPCNANLQSQHTRLTDLESLATGCRDLVKDIDLVVKLAVRLADTCEKAARTAKQNCDSNHDEWDGRAVSRLEKDLDVRRREIVEQLKRTAYFHRQAQWLLSRFPEGKFVAVPGLCRIVTKADIEASDWSLTPGRYVGVAPAEVDEDFDFEQALRDIHVELNDLNQEATVMASTIQASFEGLGM
jgi:type I restriction enzyme M protein